MTNRKAVVLLGAVTAAMFGAAVAWQRLLLPAAVLAAVLVWGLAAPRRLNYTLFVVLLLTPVTINLGVPLYPVWTVLGGATAIALLGRLHRFDPDARPQLRDAWPFALPIVLLAVALAGWADPKDLIASLIPFGCYAIIAWHVVDEARRDPAEIRRIARFCTWLGVPVGLLAIYQRISGTWPVLDQLATSSAFTAHAAGLTRSAGTLGHPIIYGTFCMAMMCVGLALRGRWWLVPLGFNAVGLLLTGSRSAWIGMAMAGAAWWIARDKKLTKRGLYAIAAAVGALALLAVFGPPPFRAVADAVAARLSNLTGSSSATARYTRTAEGWNGIWDTPVTVLIGRGPEAHVQYFEETGIADGLAQTFDNSYLTLWYDFGVVGLVAFVGLLGLVFLRFRSLSARLLLIGFAVQIWFFDFFLWPCAGGVVVMAYALAASERAEPGANPILGPLARMLRLRKLAAFAAARWPRPAVASGHDTSGLAGR